MLRAHLMVPQDDINNLYSWLNNFQVLNDTYRERLKKSKRYEETDIYIFLIQSGVILIIQMVWFILIPITIVLLFWDSIILEN